MNFHRTLLSGIKTWVLSKINTTAATIEENTDNKLNNISETLRSEIPVNVSELNNDAGYLTEHQDLSSYAQKDELPTALSDLSEDETHRLVTDEEKENWNDKSEFSGSWDDLNDKPFYDITKRTEIAIHNNLSSYPVYDNSYTYRQYALFDETPFNIKLVLVINGAEEYSGFLQQKEESSGTLHYGFGNFSMVSSEFEDTGEDYYAFYYPPALYGSEMGIMFKEDKGTISLSVQTETIENVVQLDEKYIPNTVARTDYVDNKMSFVVTFSGGVESVIVDKTFEEIKTAYNNGQEIIGFWKIDIIERFDLYEFIDDYCVVFKCLNFEGVFSDVILTIYNDNRVELQVNIIDIGYTDDLLTETKYVVGAINEVNQKLPFVVTFTDNHEGSYNSDKTFEEIKTAYNNGQEVIGFCKGLAAERFNLYGINEDMALFKCSGFYYTLTGNIVLLMHSDNTIERMQKIIDFGEDTLSTENSTVIGAINEVNQKITDITSGGTSVANATHAISADSANTATSATQANQDSNGNVIVNTYETQANAEAKFAEAKSYADTLKTETIQTILGEAVDADFDTLQEVAEWIEADTTNSAELMVRVTNIENDYYNSTNLIPITEEEIDEILNS